MKLKVGDRVRFLNDIGGGIVKRIINAKMVGVEDADGFEIPALVSNLVVVNSDEGRHSKSTPQSMQQKMPPIHQSPSYNPVPAPAVLPNESDGDDYEILMAFVPTNNHNPTDSDLDLHLINDSPFQMFYTLTKWQTNDKVRLLASGCLEADSKEALIGLTKSELRQAQIFTVSFILYKQRREFVLKTPEQVNIEINPLKFVKQGSFQENDFFDSKAFIYKVATSKINTEQIVIDSKALKKAMMQKNKSSESVKQPSAPNLPEEVDLHIECLVDDPSRLLNADILEIQKARFSTVLDLAIQAGTKRIVFIHGIGNGKLKHEIRKMLDNEYAGKVRYQDASFEEYGYGATLVLI